MATYGEADFEHFTVAMSAGNTTTTLSETAGYTGDAISAKNTTERMPVNDVFDVYYYPGFPFERPIYLVIWEVLVIITAMVNVLVIIVLLRRKMRNPTNLILAAIAISDTMTGVITLPAYIAVYQNYEESSGEYMDYENDYYSDGYEHEHSYGTTEQGYSYETYQSYEAYALSRDLCRYFMLTKFFLSKMFHTVSIFLTLFLGFQRFISVAYPFLAGKYFTKTTTLVSCIVIFLLSPVLHIYHVVNEKAADGMCEWKLTNCEGDCVFLWFVFIFRHLLPCSLLTLFTVLFIFELKKTKFVGGNREQIARRERENRRITIIVVAIVIVFLVPEIPYGFFLLVSVINKHTNTPFALEKSRAIHAAYELSLIISFHANFYIYTFLKKRFRAGLKRTVLYPIRRVMGDQFRWSMTRTLSGRSETTYKTRQSSLSSKTGTLLRPMNPNEIGQEVKNDNSSTVETKLLDKNASGTK